MYILPVSTSNNRQSKTIAFKKKTTFNKVYTKETIIDAFNKEEAIRDNKKKKENLLLIDILSQSFIKLIKSGKNSSAIVLANEIIKNIDTTDDYIFNSILSNVYHNVADYENAEKYSKKAQQSFYNEYSQIDLLTDFQTNQNRFLNNRFSNENLENISNSKYRNDNYLYLYMKKHIFFFYNK